MAEADLPPGKWSAALVGPWWPAPPTQLRSDAEYWGNKSKELANEAHDVEQEIKKLSVNEGITARDTIDKHTIVKDKLNKDSVDCEAKAEDTKRVADAIDALRSKLTSIAHDGNKKIDDILSKKGSSAEKLTQVNNVIFESNTSAMTASGHAVDGITAALGHLFKTLGIGGSAAEWLRDHNAGAGDSPPRTTPLTEDDLRKALSSGQPGGAGRDENESRTTPVGDGAPGADGRPATTATPAGNHVSNGAPGTAGRDGGSPVKPSTGPSPAPAAPGGPHVPSGGGHVPVSGAPVPSANAPGLGGLSPSALGNAVSPSSLSQGFQSGFQAGQPAAAQAMASGPIPAAPPVQPPVVQPPSVQAPPVAAPATMPMAAGVDVTGSGGHAGPAPAVPSSSFSAPPPVLGAPSSAAGSVAGVSSTPVGPLPAYGSDIRPMTAAAPPPIASAPAVPSAPVGGSPASSPSAGGLVSPVDRSTPVAAAGAPADGSSTAGAAVASATAGAVAGDGAKRLAVQRDLQAKVYAVARQEPAICWAAGLLDDDVTTLLTTDLAGGWVPPHVQLPAGVTLLAPASRRRDVSAVELLGAVSEAAAHQRHGYIPDACPGDPALTGERARHGQYVDELGPTLVDAVRHRSGLPRIAQTIASAAVRRTGVEAPEIDVLHAEIDGLRRDVTASYPRHDADAVAKWMLLSAIDALVDERQSLAHYHLAWYTTVFGRTGRR